MQGKALAILAVGAVLFLSACGKPAQPSSDQPETPGEPASAAPEASEAQDSDHKMNEAQAKAALATLPAAYHDADLDDGQSKFALCKSCHTITEGGPDLVGPNLYGVFGRKAGTKPGFAYSEALKATGITWDADQIDRWITDPRKVAQGTKMTYAGMSDPESRRDLVAYLKVATTTKGGD